MGATQTLCDADGHELDARFSVEPDFTVVIESSNGGSFPRNRDYNEALRLILVRLGSIGAELTRVELATGATKHLLAKERKLRVDGYPSRIMLADTDHEDLRRKIGSAAQKRGRKPDAKGGGNPCKRLRLYLNFPEVKPDVDSLTRLITFGGSIKPPSRKHLTAEESPSTYAGTRKRSGQGFERNPAVRVAVERWAMDAAVRHYRAAGWDTERCESQNLGYDILCTQGKRRLFVEVKGTQGDGKQVIITRNEAFTARKQRKHTELFVCRNIRISNPNQTPIVCSGGDKKIIEMWDPFACGELVPVTFFWRLPED
jgi:hypothetical protein